MFITIKNSADHDVHINFDHIVLLDGDILRMSGGNNIVLEPISHAIVKSLMFPVKKTAKVAEANSELNELFDNLHKLVGGKGKAVFTLQREKKLKELLTKHRLTPENLTTAAINIKNDAFLQGDNDNKKRYGDIDYLLRPDKAAKWAEEQEKKKRGMF